MNDAILEYFGKDMFAKMLGIELLEYQPGRARCSMKVTGNHLNGLGTGHGGAIFSLADFAFAVACNSHGTVAVGIKTDMSFVHAVQPGATLFADAREESRNAKIGTYDIHITDDSGELIAIFHGMAYRKKDSIAAIVEQRS